MELNNSHFSLTSTCSYTLLICCPYLPVIMYTFNGNFLLLEFNKEPVSVCLLPEVTVVLNLTNITVCFVKKLVVKLYILMKIIVHPCTHVHLYAYSTSLYK